ncbi:MAG TPA: Crp/Fnr family transcriptional regulator [Solimonas sp.]
MSWTEERAALVASDWFRELPPDVVTQFAAMAVRRRLADGELLFAQGDAPDGLWNVVSGRIRAGSVSGDGKELLVMQFEPGAWFGEISMFDGLPRTHDSRAVGATEMLMLPRDKFLAVLAAQPELYPHFVKMLCRKLRLAFSYIEDAQFASLPARLARRLIDLHLPQDDLGRMLGASRQSVSKELKTLEAGGVVVVDYGKLRVRDLAALQKIADAG